MPRRKSKSNGGTYERERKTLAPRTGAIGKRNSYQRTIERAVDSARTGDRVFHSSPLRRQSAAWQCRSGFEKCAHQCVCRASEEWKGTLMAVFAEQFCCGGGDGGGFPADLRCDAQRIGLPPIVEQGPRSYPGPVPISSWSWGPVGIRAFSSCRPIPQYHLACDPTTGKPVYSPPISAGPTACHVSTISAQSGDNPGPIPPVGIISPQAGSTVPSFSAAPKKSMWGAFALFAGIVILLWIFAGASLRRFV